MDHDAIVIGAGAAGEAAGSLGGEMGARVAVVERDLVGGQCSYWACMPTKTLLDAARRNHLGDYPWVRASARRDWMISREGIDHPDDVHHVGRLAATGAELVRGAARVVGPGKVEVRGGGGPPRVLEGRSVVVCTGSVATIPPVEGLADAGYWIDKEATSLRELPSSAVILGAGPMGVELSQIYTRFGVKTTLIAPDERILPKEHHRSAKVLQDVLVEEGVELRTLVKATSVGRGGKGRVVELSDGSAVEAAEVVVAVGRHPSDLRELGLEEAGVELDARGVAAPDERMRAGDGVFVAGDAAGGLQFTHLADYEGRVALRNALGRDAVADLGSVPKAVYTDPETAGVGLFLEEARDRGIDAFEETIEFEMTARGMTIDGARGHLTAVVDRGRGLLVGAFAACPGASELIHEAVLAIKTATPVGVLADTIHAFPTAARGFGNLMADAMKRMTDLP